MCYENIEELKHIFSQTNEHIKKKKKKNLFKDEIK